jgi:hypothetical protein
MSTKTVPFKQLAAPLTKPAEKWVEGAPVAAPKIEGPVKRLTVDIPEELHTRIKLHCVRRKTLITDWVRELLEAQDLNENEATQA